MQDDNVVQAQREAGGSVTGWSFGAMFLPVLYARRHRIVLNPIGVMLLAITVGIAFLAVVVLIVQGAYADGLRKEQYFSYAHNAALVFTCVIIFTYSVAFDFSRKAVAAAWQNDECKDLTEFRRKQRVWNGLGFVSLLGLLILPTITYSCLEYGRECTRSSQDFAKTMNSNVSPVNQVAQIPVPDISPTPDPFPSNPYVGEDEQRQDPQSQPVYAPPSTDQQYEQAQAQEYAQQSARDQEARQYYEIACEVYRQAQRKQAKSGITDPNAIDALYKYGMTITNIGPTAFRSAHYQQEYGGMAYRIKHMAEDLQDRHMDLLFGRDVVDQAIDPKDPLNSVNR